MKTIVYEYSLITLSDVQMIRYFIKNQKNRTNAILFLIWHYI